MKLFVGNLAFDVSEDELRGLFAAEGRLVSADIILDKDTGASRGFAFVEYGSRVDGEKAIRALDGRQVHGKSIRVDEARTQGRRP